MPAPKLDPYLFFDGNCAQAMRFYHQILGGKLQPLMTYGESPHPEQCPPGSKDRIMHACIELDDRLLMASDVPEGQSYEGMKNVSLALLYPGVNEAKRTFDGLAQGGKVVMPMGPTFWADIFGMLTDRYGTSWMVSGGMKQQPVK